MMKILKALQNEAEADVNVRHHCHVTGKYSGNPHKDCKINNNLNYKIPIVLHNLKNNDAHLIMQELGKFDFKINVMSNGLRKEMGFSLDNKLSKI